MFFWNVFGLAFWKAFQSFQTWSRVSADAHRHQVPFGIVFQAGWFLVHSPLVVLVQHHLPVGRADSTRTPSPSIPLVHQLSLVSHLDTFYLWSYIYICYADLVMRRIAMKYKTSTTSSYHWCGAWGDTGGILALRAGGRRPWPLFKANSFVSGHKGIHPNIWN